MGALSSNVHVLPLFSMFFFLISMPALLPALKCFDCVGRDCMGSTCEGDYCIISHYAPRWGVMVWGEPTVVKGCLSGKMLRGDIRSHCEVAEGQVDDNDDDPFTCFCNGADYCNGKARKLETESVPLYTCQCQGPHCRSTKQCVGELCTFVMNHRSRATERGCLNASVPLVERRSAGACMMPPITGAMHHTVSKTAEDLLTTESCVCEGDFCNRQKPSIDSGRENTKCEAFVQVKILGQWAKSRNVTCHGEFCFRANITSEIGHMSDYRTMGCASFTDETQLAEELEPIGCAKFQSEKLNVDACFRTKDRAAITRAKQSRQEGKKARPRGSRTRSSEQQEEEEEEDWDQAEEPAEREEPEEEGEEAKEEKEEGEKTEHYIFEPPTLAPQPEESTNSTLISVFLLLILLILLSGAVWKLQLHKRLFRANYDTVAGG